MTISLTMLHFAAARGLQYLDENIPGLFGTGLDSLPSLIFIVGCYVFLIAAVLKKIGL